MSINLSPHQFDGTDLVDTVRDALARSGLSANRVELEITESVLLRDNDHVLRVLTALKLLGTRIALDVKRMTAAPSIVSHGCRPRW